MPVCALARNDIRLENIPARLGRDVLFSLSA